MRSALCRWRKSRGRVGGPLSAGILEASPGRVQRTRPRPRRRSSPRVEQAIAATPAEGLTGIAVQLALWEFINQADDIAADQALARLRRGRTSRWARLRSGGRSDLERPPNHEQLDGPALRRPFSLDTFAQGVRCDEKPCTRFDVCCLSGHRRPG
jgi:hypothetical protein